MATGGEKQVCYSLAKVGTITLENTNEISNSNSIVICQNKIIVVDRKHKKVRIHRLHDGKFLDRLDSDSRTRGICLTDATTSCVLHEDGLVEMASIRSEDMSPVFTRIRSFSLHGVFDRYHSVVRVNDNIVVTGRKHDMLYWCIVSLDDGHVDSIHQICKRSEFGHSYVATKDNTVYISCYAGLKSPNTGVYGFDILNPSQCKYIYKHQRLQWPTAIVINEDGNIFVGNNGFHNDACIHQLTASCQLVAIFTPGIPPRLNAMFWDNGRLYVTRDMSHDITVFSHVYQGSYKTSEVLGSHELKQPGIDELAIQIAKINVDNGQSNVKTEMPPSGLSAKNSEDENEDSEDQISDEGQQPVIEGTSTQIGPEIPIEQTVDDALYQARIRMSTGERDLFIKFQNEIGTDIFFSKGPHRSSVGQETLEATDTFFAQSHSDMMEKWLEYKSQGKLTPELIDVIYADKRNKELHEKKDDFLNKMEQLNIIVKARAFNEYGVKEENHFFTPCMLQKESPREVIAPDKDARMVSTSCLCWVNTRTFKLSRIFQKLIAACLARWPVAKKKNTTESLIFLNCTVFDLDPVHRLFLHCENHAVLARIAIMGIDHVNAKMCTRVRKFIALNLSEITLHQDPNIKFQLCIQNIESQDIPENTGSRYSPPIEMWFVDEVHDPAAPITREHMNHARLCVAIIAICGKAMRTILGDNPSAPHATIKHAILANKTKLIRKTRNKSGKWQKALLNKDQRKIVFPDPASQDVASIDQFDISLLYILIRHISGVKPHSTDWGVAPHDDPRDQSLGANVERIRLYRNEICGHTVDGQISQPKFDDCWKRIHLVLNDIDSIVGQKLIQELEMQRRQVISVYEAC